MKKRDWNQFENLEIKKSLKKGNNSKTRTQISECKISVRMKDLSARWKIESSEYDLDLISFQFLSSKVSKFN